MKQLLRLTGIALWWFLWPVWYIYFKLWSQRSRVLIVAEDEVLIVRGILSSGDYGLPGGGKKKRESMVQSAVRELQEEVGIEAPESALELLGNRSVNTDGLAYKATYYVLRLDLKPTLTVRRYEILDATWTTREQAMRIGDTDVRNALKRYRPLTQESLL